MSGGWLLPRRVRFAEWRWNWGQPRPRLFRRNELATIGTSRAPMRSRSQSGAYQTTPPWNGFVAQPGFRLAKPFILEYPHQFRPPPPPPLSTGAYARAVREVKEYGAAGSERRTDDQTAYAIWWMEFAEGSVNRVARQLALDRQTASLADGPAVRAPWRRAVRRVCRHMGREVRAQPLASVHGDSRGRLRPEPAHGGGPAWESLRPAPPFPDYTSAHAAACAASFGALQEVFGNRVSFAMETTTAPPGMPTRTFDSFHEAAAECADSRVRLGWHFRYATDAGLALGRQIAKYTTSHSLRRSP